MKHLFENVISSVCLLHFDDGSYNRVGFLLSEKESIYLVTTVFNFPIGFGYSLNPRLYFLVEKDGELSSLEISFEYKEEANTFYAGGNRNIALIKLFEKNSVGAFEPLDGVSITSSSPGSVKLQSIFSGDAKTLASLAVQSDIVFFADPNYDDGESIFSIPLIRKGTIAGINKLQQEVLVDGLGYEGSFGSPVFERTNENGIVEYRLIGMLSNVMTQEREWKTVTSRDFGATVAVNTGFSIVQPVDHILALLSREPRVFQ